MKKYIVGGLLINEYGEVVGLVASKREATKSGVALLPTVIAEAPEEKMTLTQLRQEAVNAYEHLAEYALKKGKYDSASHSYQVTLSTGGNEPRTLSYDDQAQVIRLGISAVGSYAGDLYFEITASHSGTIYPWSYEGYGYSMGGRVQAKNFTSAAHLLSHQSNVSAENTTERTSIEDVASYLLMRLCTSLSSDLKKAEPGL